MKNTARKDFVVYAHYTIDTHELFYIGEGTEERSKRKNHRNRHWQFKVKKHGGFSVKILFSGLTKCQAESIETMLISAHREEGDKLVNICAGPWYRNPWLLNAPKEQHPMFGRKRPDSSKRMTEWNRERFGEKSPTYGLKRPDLSERNRTGTFKPFTKSIICNETNQIFDSIRQANAHFSKPINSTAITKHLHGQRKQAFGFTWRFI